MIGYTQGWPIEMNAWVSLATSPAQPFNWERFRGRGLDTHAPQLHLLLEEHDVVLTGQRDRIEDRSAHLGRIDASARLGDVIGSCEPSPLLACVRTERLVRSVAPRGHAARDEYQGHEADHAHAQDHQ